MSFKKLYSRTKKLCFKYKYILLALGLVILSLSAFGIYLNILYTEQFGGTVYDRYDRIVFVYPNEYGELASNTNTIPEGLKEKIIHQEDQMFYYHIGFNPIRWVSGVINHFQSKKIYGVSTISEQLVKNLLRNNADRTFGNKISELFGSLSLELCFSKNKILNMYINSISMGNNIRGMHTAGWYYYNKPLDSLTQDEQLSLVHTIPRPSTVNPATMDKLLLVSSPVSIYPNSFPELASVCKPRVDCKLSIDKNLTITLRNNAKKITEELWDKRGRNASVVVLDVKNKKVLSLVGSPEPTLSNFGYQIDMTKQYRPIGSTIKPFIYSLAFDKGASPDTTVTDSEHQLYLNTGFPFYPQDFDGKYRGEVRIDQALSESLNIPSVKILEFVGSDMFYDWLTKKANFELLQAKNSYGVSSALGGLEMTPESLAYLYTAFSQHGNIEPYYLFNNKSAPWQPTGISSTAGGNIFSNDSVNKINTILSNRFLGVSQFGVGSSLNLPIDNYAVKTGTSRDYHDSWVVGYTPEVVVVVWIGNVENEPLYEVTGQSGAGDLWEITMNELEGLGYISDIPFSLEEQGNTGKNEAAENKEIKLVKAIEDTSVYIFPQNNDVLRISSGKTITLSALTEGVWIVDGSPIGTGKEITWRPTNAKKYTIEHPRKNGRDMEKMNLEIIFN